MNKVQLGNKINVSGLLDGDERMWAVPDRHQRRKVLCLWSMGGAVVYAPVCDYNTTMSSMWTRRCLWLGLHENDKPEILLLKCNKYCEDRRIRSLQKLYF